MAFPINQAGIDLLKESEGCRLDAYECPGGKWTIGYGHTHGVKSGQAITQEQAEEFLVDDLLIACGHVLSLVEVPLTDNQLAALTSFMFNVGFGNFSKSTLLKLLNQGDYDSVPSQLSRWVYSGDKQLPGLASRRKAEAELFLA